MSMVCSNGLFKVNSNNLDTKIFLFLSSVQGHLAMFLSSQLSILQCFSLSVSPKNEQAIDQRENVSILTKQHPVTWQ